MQELREAWNVLDFDLSRTDPSSDVHVDCKYVLQSVLGSQVKLVRDLVLEPSHSQGEFDFLIGWDAIQHYKLHLCRVTGQLSGVDFDGNKFTTMSQFQYTSIQNAVMVGECTEFTEEARSALMVNTV